jgi:hypothetical protein
MMFFSYSYALPSLNLQVSLHSPLILPSHHVIQAAGPLYPFCSQMTPPSYLLYSSSPLLVLIYLGWRCSLLIPPSYYISFLPFERDWPSRIAGLPSFLTLSFWLSSLRVSSKKHANLSMLANGVKAQATDVLYLTYILAHLMK